MGKINGSFVMLLEKAKKFFSKDENIVIADLLKEEERAEAIEKLAKIDANLIIDASKELFDKYPFQNKIDYVKNILEHVIDGASRDFIFDLLDEGEQQSAEQNLSNQ